MASHDQPIIIKKIKKADHAHHGGAWKIAYADFVTAMMAFFLLLWLISMTTEEQKKGLADYFAPTNVSDTESGAGGVLAGTSFDTKGGKTSSAATKEVGVPVNDKDRLASVSAATKNGDAHTSNDGAVRSDSREDLQSKYDQQFASAAASIKQAWQAMPDITKIEDNLLVQQTEDGLDIVIMDQEGRRMFPEGSKYPLEVTRKAIAAIAPILQRLPNEISISGHTAAGGSFSDPSYGAWDLSSDRANVVRSILGEFGLSNDHVHDVAGRATTEPFFPNDPYLAANERVQITVMNGASPVPPGLKP